MSIVIPKADNFLRMPLNGGTSVTTGPFDIENYVSLWLQVEWTADADTASTFGMRFSVDPSSGIAFPIPIDETLPAPPALPETWAWEYGNIPDLTNNAFDFVGRTTAGGFFVHFLNPPPSLQFIYTRAGGNRQFVISLFGRAG